MINALHLLWIIPLSTCIGLAIMGFIVAVSDNYKYEDIYNKGVEFGINLMKAKYEIRGDKDETNI